MLPDPVPVDQMMLLSADPALRSPLSPPARCHARAGCCTGEAAELQAVAWGRARRAVLRAVNEVGNLVVHGDVVDLRDGQVDVFQEDPRFHRIFTPPSLTTPSIPVGGIDPIS